MADRHRGGPAKFPEKEASESIFRVNQAPPTPDVSSLARRLEEGRTRDSEASDENENARRLHSRRAGATKVARMELEDQHVQTPEET